MLDLFISFFSEKFKGKGLRVSPEDERDFMFKSGLEEKDLKLYVDLWNSYFLDQGDSGRCSAYSTTHAFVSIKVREEKNKSLFFDADQQWFNQLEYPATALPDLEGGGDYLRSALRSLKRYGLEFRGKMYHIDSYSRVSRSGIKKALSDGKPVIIGIHTKGSLCDSNWNYKPVLLQDATGGHAVVIVGYDDEKQRYICQNSWSNWGEDLSSRFYIKYSDSNSIVESWVIN